MGISSSPGSFTTFTSRAATPPWTVTAGTPAPLGVTSTKNGFNFSLYSKNATQVSLILYAADDLEAPLVTVPFDQFKNRTGRVWHAGIPANVVEAATYYA